jgi:hypothetical protein
MKISTKIDTMDKKEILSRNREILAYYRRNVYIIITQSLNTHIQGEKELRMHIRFTKMADVHFNMYGVKNEEELYKLSQ